MADDPEINEGRRDRIAKAIASTTRGEEITLDELAALYGIGKPAFVNIRDQRISNFPPPRIDGKKYYYPRLKALKLVDQYERRGDVQRAEKQSRLARLIGVKESHAALPISDLQKAYNLRMEMQAAEEAQGNLVSRQQVQAVAGKVHTIMSRALSDLGAVIDPNGQYTPEIRQSLDMAGKALLLRIHGELKDMLTPDAPGTRQPSRNRKAAGGARSNGARR